MLLDTNKASNLQEQNVQNLMHVYVVKFVFEYQLFTPERWVREVSQFLK